MPKEGRSTNDQEIVDACGSRRFGFQISGFFRHSSFTRHVSRFNDSTVQRWKGHYSHRSASIGSRHVARTAGTTHAKSPVTKTSADTVANVAGSVGVTPNNWAEMYCVAA